MALAGIAWLTLRPAHASSLNSHLCLVCGAHGGVDILLNTLLFVPLGVGLSLSGLSVRNAVLFCFALSLSIEAAQAFVVRGRDSTLSDVVTNTLGGSIGFWSALTAPVWLAPSRKTAAWLTALWGGIWVLIQVVSSYSVAPSLPTSQYYGDLAHPLGGRTMFHGDVASARIGAIPIPNGAFVDSRSIRQALLNGTPIEAVLRLDEPTPNFASIIRVADDKQRGLASIAENGDQLIFGIRTRASNLRLLEPAFALPGVFGELRPPADSATQTLVISAGFRDGTVRIAAQTPLALRELNLSPRAELGWTVLLPHQWYLGNGGIERTATFLWMGALLIPLGYWGTALARQSNRAGAFALIAVPAVVLAGLILVPTTFGLRSATLLAWISAVSGVGVGTALTLAFSGYKQKKPRACLTAVTR